MRVSRFRAFLAAAIITFASAAVAADEKPLTNDDVIKLTKAGLPADVIVAKIRTTPCAFDTSADALLLLSKAGVGEAVLNAMMNAAAGTQATPPAATDCANLPPPSIATGDFWVIIAISGPQKNTKPWQDPIGVFAQGMCLWRCGYYDGRWGFTWENVTSVCLLDEPTPVVETRSWKSGPKRLEIRFTRSDEPHVVKLWDRITNSGSKDVPVEELYREIPRFAKRCIPCQQP